jgi:hypothetical protein
MAQLATNQLSSGKIVYFENAKDSSALIARCNYLKQAKIVLKNETKDVELKIGSNIETNSTALLVYIKFIDETIKEMAYDDFALYVNNNVIARSDTASSGTNIFKMDLKPSFDSKEAQKVDVDWGRKFSETYSKGFASNIDMKAKGAFSTKPDSAALNSIQLNIGYSLIWDVELLKYFGLSGKLGSEHPQDFSRPNMVGSIVVSTIIPYTDRLARFIANNKTNSSIGLLIQPSVEFVKNTSIKDSSYIRGVLQSSWDIPLIKDQYINIYGAAYFRKGDRPRSYIEMTFEQDISESIAIVAKWVNGELPPLFQREADLRIGLRFK